MRIRIVIFLALCVCSSGQIIHPPAKGVLDFYYLGKSVEFHGDVGGTYDDLRITNYSVVVEEPIFETWWDGYGFNMTTLYVSFSNAYYSGLAAIATNTPEDGWGIYYNADNTNWYAAATASLVELSNSASSIRADFDATSNALSTVVSDLESVSNDVLSLVDDFNATSNALSTTIYDLAFVSDTVDSVVADFDGASNQWLKVEMDSIWTNAQAFGFTMGGSLDMGSNRMTNVLSVMFSSDNSTLTTSTNLLLKDNTWTGSFLADGTNYYVTNGLIRTHD